jgi:hypothetical protein
MAIYIQIFPEDAAHVLKYMSTIKTIYEMKGNKKKILNAFGYASP